MPIRILLICITTTHNCIQFNSKAQFELIKNLYTCILGLVYRGTELFSLNFYRVPIFEMSGNHTDETMLYHDFKRKNFKFTIKFYCLQITPINK